MTVAEQLIARGKRESLLNLIKQKFGTINDTSKKAIMETQDPDKLDQALGLILTAESIEEILCPLDDT